MGLATIADLAFSEGLELILLCGPDLRGAEALRLARAYLPAERPTQWYYLDEEGPDLARALGEHPGAVLLAHGLEYLPQDERQPLMDQLNLLRDTLLGSLGWLILFVPLGDLAEFQLRCADLYHWRSLLVVADEKEVPIDRDTEIRRRSLVRQQDADYTVLRAWGLPPADPQVRTDQGHAMPLLSWVESLGRKPWDQRCGVLIDDSDAIPSPAFHLLHGRLARAELRAHGLPVKAIDHTGPTPRFLPPQGNPSVFTISRCCESWYRHEFRALHWPAEFAALAWPVPLP